MNEEVDKIDDLPSEKIIDLTEAEEVENDDGPNNLFEKWDTDYSDKSASSVYSWGRD